MKFTVTKSLPGQEVVQNEYEDRQKAMDHLHDVFIAMGIDPYKHAHYLDPFPADSHGPQVLVWCRGDAIVSCDFPVDLSAPVGPPKIQVEMSYGEPYKVHEGTSLENWCIEVTLRRDTEPYTSVLSDATCEGVLDMAKRFCAMSDSSLDRLPPIPRIKGFTIEEFAKTVQELTNILNQK